MDRDPDQKLILEALRQGSISVEFALGLADALREVDGSASKAADRGDGAGKAANMPQTLVPEPTMPPGLIIPLNVVSLIADFLASGIDDSINPLVYLKLAGISRNFYRVFMSDHLWRFLDPYGLKQGIAKAFCVRSAALSEIRRMELLLLWERTREPSPHVSISTTSSNLDIKLRVLLLGGTVNHVTRHLAWCAVNSRGNCLRVLSQFSDIKAYVLAAVSECGTAINFAGAGFAQDREIAMAATGSLGRSLQWFSGEVRADPEVVLSAVAQNGAAFAHACSDLQRDREFVLRAVAAHGWALMACPNVLWDDAHVVALAAAEDLYALRWASPELLADRAFVLELFRVGTTHYERYEIRECDFDDFRFLLSRYSDDRAVVMAVVSKWGRALQHASTGLRERHEVVLAAIHHDGSALEFASVSLQKHPFVVHDAVCSDGLALRFAFHSACTYENIVMAVCHNGLALRYASTWLNNPKVVRLACLQNPEALQFSALRSDAQFVRQIVRDRPSALKHADEELQRDAELRMLAGMWFDCGVKKVHRLVVYA